VSKSATEVAKMDRGLRVRIIVKGWRGSWQQKAAQRSSPPALIFMQAMLDFQWF